MPRLPCCRSLARHALAAFCAALLALPAVAATDARWTDFVAGFVEASFVANPSFAVYAGRHEFDGRLPDLSKSAIEARVVQLRAQRQAAQAFPEAALTPRERFERDYLLWVIDSELYWTAEAEWPFRNPAWYFGAIDPAAYLDKPYAPPEQRLRAYLAYARALPAALAQIRANLRTPMPAPWIEYGHNAFAGYAEFFAQDAAVAFASVDDPALQAELRAVNAGAAAAMRELAAWFESERPRGTQGYPLGAQGFARMLQVTEQVDLPLERLAAIGRADLERNTSALRAACQLFLPGGVLSDCVARVRARKPEGGSVAAATRQLPELEAFLRKADLVTIPGDERALVAQAPPYNAQNFAYIITPGPYEKGVPATYYIAAPNPDWTAEERAQYVQPDAALRFVSVHEVWPGHFLQFLHSNRSASTLGQLYVGYAFAEGWAHYSEEMLWDAGLGAGDPEQHIGQLLQALWRNVRFVSAIGLHTGGMSLEESERMFRAYAFLDAGNARQQALRGTYDPAYLNYTLGKLMIRKLREDWTATRGGRAAWKPFHDALLSHGGPPLPLLRRTLLGDTSPAL